MAIRTESPLGHSADSSSPPEPLASASGSSSSPHPAAINALTASNASGFDQHGYLVIRVPPPGPQACRAPAAARTRHAIECSLFYVAGGPESRNDYGISAQ